MNDAMLALSGLSPVSGKTVVALYAMLRAVEDAQLEGLIATPEEALALLQNRFPPD